MTQQPAIAILGASGRMGQMLAQTILASDNAKLVAAADRVGSDWVGRIWASCRVALRMGSLCRMM